MTAAAARPRAIAPFDLLAQAIAEAPHLVVAPYLETLGLEWDEETAELRKMLDINGEPSRGARVHGFSREGLVRMSKHKDLEAHSRAADRLFNRIYGKPRASVELAGHAQGATMVSIPMDTDRVQKVSLILQQCGAVQPTPPEPNDED